MKRNLSLPQKLQKTENQLQKQKNNFKKSWVFYQPKQKDLSLFRSINMQQFPLVKIRNPQHPNSNSSIINKIIVGCSLPKIGKTQQESKTERQNINSQNFQNKIKIQINVKNIEQEAYSNKNSSYNNTLQRIKDLKQFELKKVCSLKNSQRSSSPNISLLLERRGIDDERQNLIYKLSLAKSNFEIIGNKTKMQNSLQKYFNGCPIRKKLNFC